MAIEYKVERKRDETGGFTGDEEYFITTDWKTSFLVTVSDPVDPSFDPATIDTLEASQAPGLPRVNESTYFNETIVCPYLLCRTKTCKRDTKNNSMFWVDCGYSTGARRVIEGYCEPIPINPWDLAPQEEAKIGSQQRRIYVDYAGTTCQLPDGNEFKSPFMEDIGTIRLRIQQYEQPPVLYTTVLTRSFVVNSTTYRSQAPYTWKIGAAEGQEVYVQTATGPQLAVLMTYPIEFTQYPTGWRDTRTLIDSHYIDDADGDKLKAFTDYRGVTRTEGWLDTNGNPIDRTVAAAPTTYAFETTRSIDFNTFLRI